MRLIFTAEWICRVVVLCRSTHDTVRRTATPIPTISDSCLSDCTISGDPFRGEDVTLDP